jgi:hypothetical protein
MPKTCSRCGQRKPLDAFYKQVGGAQGRRSRCKACYKELERETYAQHPEVQAARRRLVARWRDEGQGL